MNTLCTVVMFNQALIKCLMYFSCSVHAFVSNTVGLIGIGDVHVENTINLYTFLVQISKTMYTFSSSSK